MLSRLPGLLIVGFWVLMMGLLFEREVLPRYQRAREATYETALARRLEPDESQMGIFLGSVRMGVLRTSIRPLANGWTRIASLTRIEAPQWGLAHLGEIRCVSHIDPSYSLRSFTLSVGGPFGKTLVEGMVQGEEFVLFITPPGSPRRERRIPYDGRATLGNGLSPFLSMPDLEVGKEWSIAMLDPLDPAAVRFVSARVESREPLLSGGVEEPAWVVVLEDPLGTGVAGSREFRAWIAADGRILRQELPLGERLRVRLEREPVTVGLGRREETEEDR